MPAASACASASSAEGEGSAKRSSTFAALIFSRLPDAASTCSEVSLSTRTLPALNAPSSSKKTCMERETAGRKDANYTAARALGQRALALCAPLWLSMAVFRQDAPIMSMLYRRLGDSGLEVSELCLGTMMFGDRTDAATAQRIVASAFDAGVNFIDTADVYAKGASETIVGRGDRRQPPALDPRDQGRQRDDADAARRRPVPALDHAGLRRQPEAAGDRLHRHLLPAQGRHRDAARRDDRGDRRPDPRRQDPLLRRVELSRLAHRRSRSRLAPISACRSRSSASRTTTR